MVSRSVQLNALPSIGTILGTVGNADVLNSINNRMSNSCFFNSSDDVFQKDRNQFIQTFIAPIKANIIKLKNITKKVKDKHPDEIVALTSDDDFIEIPPAMFLPILTYAPVKRLFEQGRIFGFGYEYENIKDQEDVYGRLINNGLVSGIRSDNLPKDGYIIHECVYKSHDPDLTFDELDMIEDTREYIDKLLETTQFDPTDFPNKRG